MQKELTSQEQKILNLLVEGISPKEIAYKLNISNRTVEFHLTNIYNKLGVHSIQELLAKQNSAGQQTKTTSSAGPEAAPPVKIKGNKFKLLIPLGIGILIGVVSMLFVWCFSIEPSGGVLLKLHIYMLSDGLIIMMIIFMGKITVHRPL